jgi:phage-related protein
VLGDWRFFDFNYPNNSNPIEDWYQRDLSEDAQYAFWATLKDIQKIENHRNWLCFKRMLSGRCREYRIWELWFACGDKRQYRLLGTFGPNRRQVTFVMGCYHKSSVYTPANALETAYDRAKALSESRAKTCERKIPTDR